MRGRLIRPCRWPIYDVAFLLTEPAASTPRRIWPSTRTGRNRTAGGRSWPPAAFHCVAGDRSASSPKRPSAIADLLGRPSPADLHRTEKRNFVDEVAAALNDASAGDR